MVRWCTSSVGKRISTAGVALVKQWEKVCVEELGRPGPSARSGIVKIGRMTAEPSVSKVINELSEVSTAEIPGIHVQDLVRSTMPPGRGSLGCRILATIVFARLNRCFSSEANLKGSLCRRAIRSSAHSSYCDTAGQSSVDSVLVSSGGVISFGGKVDEGSASEVSVVMCSEVVDTKGAESVGFEPSKRFLGSGRDWRVLRRTVSSLRLPR